MPKPEYITVNVQLELRDVPLTDVIDFIEGQGRDPAKGLPGLIWDRVYGAAPFKPEAIKLSGLNMEVGKSKLWHSLKRYLDKTQMPRRSGGGSTYELDDMGESAILTLQAEWMPRDVEPSVKIHSFDETTGIVDFTDEDGDRETKPIGSVLDYLSEADDY